jgi:hypothetical protein
VSGRRRKPQQWFTSLSPRGRKSELFLTQSPSHFINPSGLPHSGVRRCERCGEIRGRFLQALLLGYGGTITCICEGLKCRYCKRNRVRRPLTNYIGDDSIGSRHTAWFGYLIPCRECQALGRGPKVISYGEALLDKFRGSGEA